MDLRYPLWQVKRLAKKLRQAEEAIADRMEDLPFTEDNEQEHRLLSDGLWIIQDVRKIRLG
jgi:hypothetical protein